MRSRHYALVVEVARVWSPIGDRRDSTVAEEVCNDPVVGTPDDVLGRRVVPAMVFGRVPGCAVACVSDGAVVWSAGFGTADETNGTPASSGTAFQVASVSKVVTAWATMALVADGTLSLDSPVIERLTTWRFDRSPVDPTAITLRHLLTHTSGLPSSSSPTYATIQAVPGLEEVLGGHAGGPAAVPDQPPGTAFRYSNLGYAVIELVVEQVSGQPFAEFARDRILIPLGMHASTFDPTAILAPETAAPHHRRGRPLPRVFFNNRAAGGLVTTAQDLAILAQAMTVAAPGGRGATVIPADLVQDMWSSPPAAIGAFGLRTGGYGMGQFSGTLASGTRFVANQGSRPGWRSLLLCLPDRGDALIVMTNTDSGLPVLAYLAARWLRHVLHEPLALHRIIRLRRPH